MEKYKHASSQRFPYIRFLKLKLEKRLFRLRKITGEPKFNILKSAWMMGK